MPPNWGVETPPLGLAYISAALKQDHHQVEIIDYNIKIWHELKEKMPVAWAMDSFEKWTDEDLYDLHLADKIDPLFQKLLNDIMAINPDVVGFSHFLTSVHPVERICKKIRKLFPKVKILMGGPHVKDEYSERVVRMNYADAAVIGEGEATSREILRLWEKDSEVKPVSGAVMKGILPETIIRGKDRPAIEVNELPMPDFSSYALSNYLTHSLPFSMSRGCVKRCTFCAEAPFWRKYRVRSADSIFQELKEGHEKYGIRLFRSNDSLMNGDFEVLVKLVDKMIEEKLPIKWQGMCRLDKRMDSEILKKMKTAGCDQIFFGLESGSQKIADLMKKGVRVDDALKVIHDTHEAGIVASVFIIVGFPKENWLDFVKTMIFLWKIRKKVYLANVSDAGLSPGAPMELRQKQFGIVEDSKFGGSWHDPLYTNTIYHRRLKLWLMRRYIKALNISENKMAQPLEPLFGF